jgi:hypothetical protein
VESVSEGGSGDRTARPRGGGCSLLAIMLCSVTTIGRLWDTAKDPLVLSWEPFDGRAISRAG